MPKFEFVLRWNWLDKYLFIPFFSRVFSLFIDLLLFKGILHRGCSRVGLLPLKISRTPTQRFGETRSPHHLPQAQLFVSFCWETLSSFIIWWWPGKFLSYPSRTLRDLLFRCLIFYDPFYCPSWRLKFFTYSIWLLIFFFTFEQFN